MSIKVFNMVKSQINKISKNYNINKNVSVILQAPNTIIQTNFPVKIKDDYKIFQGYRVQHNNICGPYKGGLRFNENVDISGSISVGGNIKVNEINMGTRTFTKNVDFKNVTCDLCVNNICPFPDSSVVIDSDVSINNNTALDICSKQINILQQVTDFNKGINSVKSIPVLITTQSG